MRSVCQLRLAPSWTWRRSVIVALLCVRLEFCCTEAVQAPSAAGLERSGGSRTRTAAAVGLQHVGGLRRWRVAARTSSRVALAVAPTLGSAAVFPVPLEGKVALQGNNGPGGRAAAAPRSAEVARGAALGDSSQLTQPLLAGGSGSGDFADAEAAAAAARHDAVAVAAEEGTTAVWKSPAAAEVSSARRSVMESEMTLARHELLLLAGLAANLLLILGFATFWCMRPVESPASAKRCRAASSGSSSSHVSAPMVMIRTATTVERGLTASALKDHDKSGAGTRQSSSASTSSMEGFKRLREEQLGQLEKTAVRIAGHADEVPSSGGLGYLAAVPWVDQSAEDDAAAKLRYWRDGFLGWWRSEADFQAWCTNAAPSPIGSVGLLDIKDVKKLPKAPTKVCVINDKSDGVEASDLEELHFSFATETRAIEWIGAMSRLLTRLHI
eukprot:TRINITY_DN40786_c1_g1_i1.p1 TRINITY_DN40786_c1_g1~~TRINITY_DN40786_c1_g1_i1.p1  ORF type:complete len:441 (-),score=117.61 TRINITY_DN40786_c1_g1_i1:121-1443(-)